MAEEREAKNPVQSAERIFQVMETLADHWGDGTDGT